MKSIPGFEEFMANKKELQAGYITGAEGKAGFAKSQELLNKFKEFAVEAINKNDGNQKEQENRIESGGIQEQKEKKKSQQVKI